MPLQSVEAKVGNPQLTTPNLSPHRGMDGRIRRVQVAWRDSGVSTFATFMRQNHHLQDTRVAIIARREGKMAGALR